MIVQTEADVTAQVVAYCRCLGLVLERQNTGAAHYPNRDGTTRLVRYGTPGAADWTATLPDGRRLELEIKRPGARPTQVQLDRLQQICASNGVGFWTDSVDHLMAVLPHVLAGASVEETRYGNGPIVNCKSGCKACGGKS